MFLHGLQNHNKALSHLYKYIAEMQNLKHILPSRQLRVVFLGHSKFSIPAQVQTEFDHYIFDQDNIRT